MASCIMGHTYENRAYILQSKSRSISIFIITNTIRSWCKSFYGDR